MPIDRCVRRFGVKMAGFDLRDLAPGGHGRWGDVTPGLAIVAGDVDQAVVGSGPDGGSAQRRGSDGVDDAEAIGHLLVNIPGGDGVEVCGHFRPQAGKIGADFFPGAAAVPGTHDELIGVVERLIGL
jgi:hypothetical protein